MPDHEAALVRILYEDKGAPAQAVLRGATADEFTHPELREAFAAAQVSADDGAVNIAIAMRTMNESARLTRKAAAVLGDVIGDRGVFADPECVADYLEVLHDAARRREALAVVRDLERGARDRSISLSNVAASTAQRLTAIADADRGDDWPPLRPFGVHDLEEAPIHVFPKPVEVFAVLTAQALQVPVDLVAQLCLSAMSAAVVGKAEAEPRRGWREVLGLWTLTALPPAERKSAAVAVVTRPLYTFEAARAREETPERTRAQDERDAAEERVKAAKARLAHAAGEARGDAREELDNARAELDALPPPRAAYRLVVDDVTPERLVELEAEQGGRIAMFSSEGGLLRTATGRSYSRTGAPSFDVLLKSHAGDPIAQDRKSGSVRVDRPVLVLGLAVQPAILHDLTNDPAARGVGLLARFLFAMPQGLRGAAAIRPPAVPPDVTAHYEATLRAVLELPQGETPVVIPFAQDADDALADFEREIEPRLGPNGDLHAIGDWAGKLAGAVVRMATIFATVDEAPRSRCYPDTVERQHVEHAVEYARWLIPHAVAAFDVAAVRPEIETARRILAWIDRTGRRCFTAREAFLALKGRGGSVGSMADVWPAIDELLARAYIAETAPLAIPRLNEKPAPRTSPTYRVRPKRSLASLGSAQARELRDGC